MLPVINLDNETYEEIFERAKNMIAGIYPEWTDYNEHDPGITFLQLMAWMKEMQQFHLDQIGEEHLAMYLKMLGMSRKEKQPARTLARVESFPQSFLLPQGTRLLAGQIPFETEKSRFLEASSLVECVSINQQGETGQRVRLSRQGGRLRCLPFGSEPAVGCQFLMKFDRPLTKGVEHAVWFDLSDDYPVPRNPVDREFIPLTQLKLEAYGPQGFLPCLNVTDGTDWLLHGGLMEFSLPAEMAPMEDGAFGLRLTLTGGEYDVAPVLEEISLHMVPVCQQAVLADYEEVILPPGPEGRYHFSSSRRIFTQGRIEVYQRMRAGYVQVPSSRLKAERSQDGLSLAITPLTEKKTLLGKDILPKTEFCIVGYDAAFRGPAEFQMDGFPGQMLAFNDSALLYHRLELMAENPEQPGAWEKWQRMETFHASTPESRHYRVNAEKGFVEFGDCEQGMAPEGRLRILRYIQSLGSGGNVRRGQISAFENDRIQAAVTNQKDVSDGSDEETTEACFARFGRESGSISRAVTAEDYEILTRQTPGLRIQQVRAISGELGKEEGQRPQDNSVTIVAQPFSLKPQARLSAGYMENISQMLNRCRLVGTKVQVLSPEYIGASLFVDVLVKPHYPAARQMIEAAARQYFQDAASGFGAAVEESELYGLLDSMDCVREIRNLSIHVQGKGVRRTANGSIRLPVNGLVYLKQADYLVTAGGE